MLLVLGGAPENINLLNIINYKRGKLMESKKKEYKIIVNTQEKTWGEKEISYKEVVILAFGTYSDDSNVVYTVTYSKGDKPHQEGSLVKGKSLKIKNGMIFNVSQTNKS